MNKKNLEFAGALLAVEYVCSKVPNSESIKVSWSKDLQSKKVALQFLSKDDKVLCESSNCVARYLARTHSNLELYGNFIYLFLISKSVNIICRVVMQYIQNLNHSYIHSCVINIKLVIKDLDLLIFK